MHEIGQAALVRVALDIETDGLKPTKIWCIVCQDLDRGDVYEWVGEDVKRFRAFARSVSFIVCHNGIDFDLPTLQRLLGVGFDPGCVFDTLVVSRLLQFQLEGGHSLENWGRILQHPKVGLDIVDWSAFTENMLVRCRCDTALGAKLYEHLLFKARIDYKDAFREAIKTEHQIAFICREMHDNGFVFNIEDANALYLELEKQVSEIGTALQEAFPPKVEIKISPVRKVERKIVTPFNPSSMVQILERLEGSWAPKEKTEKGQFRVNEANLATLKEDAPEACKRLVERLLLAGRQRALKQWIDAYDITTKRIHPRFLPIGTWTHRLGHRQPNLANVAAPKSIKYKGRELADMATALGGRMRGLWEASEGSHLVGCDAEGIQLRIFGHYINDNRFIKALVDGRKEDGSDPHSLNAAILSCDRDIAKTFIYAFLLGAGDKKIGEILGKNSKKGGQAKRDFVAAYPGLRELKETAIPLDAVRGYFEGFDGRLVACNSEHLMLAGYLQTGEACIMKKAAIIWRKEIEKLGIPYKLVTWPHDEWQTEVFGDKAAAEAVGKLQSDSIRLAGESFGLRCPMAGSYRIGSNWLETH